jgi:hypothetical protein
LVYNKNGAKSGTPLPDRSPGSSDQLPRGFAIECTKSTQSVSGSLRAETAIATLEVQGEHSRPIEKQAVPDRDHKRREDHQYHRPKGSWWTHLRMEGVNTRRVQARQTTDSQIGKISPTVRVINWPAAEPEWVDSQFCHRMQSMNQWTYAWRGPGEGFYEAKSCLGIHRRVDAASQAAHLQQLYGTNVLAIADTAAGHLP